VPNLGCRTEGVEQLEIRCFLLLLEVAALCGVWYGGGCCDFLTVGLGLGLLYD
jgi:hypothetical protein